MTAVFTYKVYFALGVLISVGLTSFADNDVQNRSKYKYGYVISHDGGSTQAHLESRDGNLALGRYYVNHQNGTGQKVTYFADDLGFHTGVSYSSQNGKGSSKTQIAMGQKALAAFGNSGVEQTAAPTVSSPTLLFGKKILQTALDTITPKPTSYPKLNYTPVPGGFFLTHESVDTFNGTTEHPSYVAGLTSQGFSSTGGKYSAVVSQGKANTPSFSPTSENVRNQIKQLQIQFTTPSINSYTQQSSVFSGSRDETTQFAQRDPNVKVSTYATSFNDLSYSKEKSIEKTNFADIDSHILSEVHKHAQQIIMKDLQNSQNVNYQGGLAGFTSGVFPSSPVTMQPIVVTNDGETGITNIISTTAIPEVSKASKNLQSGTINSVKITEKNPDQALGDSGYFRFSLSPSLASSINVSQTPHQSINVESADRNSVSNNSTLCELNLCQKDNQEIFTIDLITDKPVPSKKPESAPLVAGSQDISGTDKVVQTFYPENKLHDERHYITTIDVQKAISLDVNQNEDGNIQLAQNFAFNKLKPLDQVRNQYNVNPTPQPIISNQISVTPDLFGPESNLNAITTSRKPYILNTVTTAPGLFDVTPNQNLAVLQGLNDISSGQIQYGPTLQERIGSSRLGYENQLVVPPPPVGLTNEAADAFRQRQEELQEVEKSIQELRQQILSDIDAQHDEEQRKQNLVDEERKQYFENLKKVEELKNHAAVNSHTDVIPTTASPVSPVENVNNVELVPQTQFVSNSEKQYQTGPQTQFQPPPQTQFETVPQTQYQSGIQTQFQTGTQSQFQSGAQVQLNTGPQTQFQPPTQTQFESAPVSQTQFEAAPVPQTQFEAAPAPQTEFQPVQQTQFEATPAPQTQFQSGAQEQLNTGPQNQYLPATQTQYEQQPQTQYQPAAQPQYVSQPQSFQTEIKDFTHEVAVPQPAVQQISNIEVYPKQVLPFNQNVQTTNTARQYTVYDSPSVFAIDNNIQQSSPAYTTEKIQLGNYVPQIAPVAFQQRYPLSQTVQLEEKSKNVQPLTVLNGQINTVPVGISSEVVPPAKVPQSKQLLVNRVVPFDYNRLLQVKQPVPLLQTYQLPLTSDSKFTEIYPQQVALPIQIPQTYKFLAFPDVISPISDKQYISTLTQKATNKVRVQPLKPSSPEEDSQRTAVQNLLPQPQFQQTYYYPGLPVNNRLQLRHIRKNQISNSDQVRSQSVIRRGKSLKNLRIEYGFKPPLRPSVEFSEEVKPSIYGSSVQPQ